METRRGELLSMLRFNAVSGLIWLNEHRRMVLHTRALAELRRELFDSLGVDRARGLLVRMGFASGRPHTGFAVDVDASGMGRRHALRVSLGLGRVGRSC